MLEKLLAALKGKKSDNDEPVSGRPLELATAALLVEAARADDDYAKEEIAIIDKILARRFNMENEAVQVLRVEAEVAQSDANDLYQFSSVVKDNMSPEEKIGLIEDLWEVILCDDVRDPHEDALIRRLAGLIYVNDPDAGAARQRVIARLNQS